MVRRSPAPLPPVDPTTHLLEINLISAQSLKPPSATLRRLQTYAVAWVDPNHKLRTQIDRLGAENPTWNDKFFFRVDAAFLAGETSAVTVEIFAVGVLTDHLLGSVRFFLSNVLSPTFENHAPAFVAQQIRRPSGKCHGILNIGAMVIDGAGIESLAGVSAIGYRDLMGKARRKKHRRGLSDMSSGSESCGGDSVDFSDGTESTGSTSSSTASTVLRELNGFCQKEMAGKKGKDEGEAIILCGLGFQKKVHLSVSDEDIKALRSLDLNTT